MEASGTKEIIISAHESAHAVASVRLGLSFEYVTLDDPNIGPHVQHFENLPRPIVFYRWAHRSESRPITVRKVDHLRA
jgi:hypothetical protein